MAYRNIIFDMGNVLIHFDPQRFIRRLGVNAADASLLMTEVFRSLEWCCMDRGTYTDQEAAEQICRRVPERLHDSVWQLVCHWDEPALPIDGMAGLVTELKEAGYGLYLLSNASLRQHTYWPNIPGSEHFDGTFISSDYRLVKPQPEAYRAMLAKFGLVAQECIFIDDSPPNIEGSIHCGIPGIIFRGDVSALRQALRQMGISISA